MGHETDGKRVQMTLPLEEIGPRKYRAGSLRRHEQVREAVKAALKRCGLPREVVAEEISRLTGDAISVNHLNNWTAESKGGYRLPIEHAAALAIVTGDLGPVRAALDGIGAKVLDRDQVPYYELGVLTAEDMDRKRKRKEVLERLGL